MSVEVVEGDCRKILRDYESTFDFAFADPPFGIGQDYDGFEDKFDPEEFERWVDIWIKRLWKSLTPDGVMCLHGPDALVEIYLRVSATRRMSRIAWVNWHYRFGQCGRGNWIDARCHCLIYAKGKSHTWNPEEVLVDSDRASVYGDARIHETENGGKRLPGTIWGIPSDGPYWGRVQGNSKERRKGHPNQLPEVYLERLIRAYTNPGDRIIDPFGGSGTTAVVADALGRDCVTIEISPRNAERIRDRVRKGSVRIEKVRRTR